MNPDQEVPPLISNSTYHHDDIRMKIIWWAQKYGKYRVYSEPLGYPGYKPDLVLYKNPNTIYIEIQVDDNKDWRETKKYQYKGKHLITIQPLLIPNSLSSIGLQDHINRRMENEVDKYKPKKEAPYKPRKTNLNSPIKRCSECDAPKKSILLYEGLCQKCRKKKWKEDKRRVRK